MLNEYLMKDEYSIEEIQDLIDSIKKNPQQTIKTLQNKIDDFCNTYNYCPNCYCKLKIKQYKEARPYQDSVTYENLNYWYCPMCNKRKEDLL